MKKYKKGFPLTFHKKNKVHIPEVMTLNLIREELTTFFDENMYNKEVLLPLLSNCEVDEFTVSCQDRYLDRMFDEQNMILARQHENDFHEIKKLILYHEGEKNHIINCLADLENEEVL